VLQLSLLSHFLLFPKPIRFDSVTVILGRHLLQTALEVKKIGRAIETHEKLYMYQVSKVPYKLKSCHDCNSTCPNGTDHQRDVTANNTVMLSNILSPVTHRCTGLQLTKARALANKMREVSWAISVSPHLSSQHLFLFSGLHRLHCILLTLVATPLYQSKPSVPSLSCPSSSPPPNDPFCRLKRSTGRW
jgi:hypothetical protein